MADGHFHAPVCKLISGNVVTRRHGAEVPEELVTPDHRNGRGKWSSRTSGNRPPTGEAGKTAHRWTGARIQPPCARFVIPLMSAMTC
jgi:hypothetical protein